MFRSRVLLAIMLVLIIAGSIHASGRAKGKTNAHVKAVNATKVVSTGGGFVLQAAPTDGSGLLDDSFATDQDELLAGGRFRLSGGLSLAVTTNGDDESDEEFAAQACPDVDNGLEVSGTTFLERLVGLLGQWGMCPDLAETCAGDLDGDGLVGPADLCQLLADW